MAEIFHEKSSDQPPVVHQLNIGSPWDFPARNVGNGASTSSSDKADQPSINPNMKPVVPDAATARVVAADHTGVVHIKNGRSDAPDDQTSVADGSGFFIDGKGTVITDAHVALPDKGMLPELTIITDDGKSYPGRIVKIDKAHDLAEITIDQPTPAGSKPLALTASGAEPKVGDPVWALGHPMGVKPQFVSPGTVSGATTQGAMDRKIYARVFGATAQSDAAYDKFAHGDQTQQTYATAPLQDIHQHIETGNSGGPEVKADGTVASVVDRGNATDYHAFGTPAADVRTFLATPSTDHFQYKPDPDRPGYQILSSITDGDGKPVAAHFTMMAYTAMFQACRPDKHK